MKKFYIFWLLFFCLSANAAELQNIDYKVLNDGTKIRLENGIWTEKISRKSTDYYVKKSLEGASDYSKYYSSDDNFTFSTATQQEFLYKGSLIGYSNSDLKFYEISLSDDVVNRRELLEAEVKEMFPDYEIIKISDFKETNSVKVKSKFKEKKFILLNDTDRNFDNYSFTSNNTELTLYHLIGFIKVRKKGLIQFSRFGENTKSYPWFVILIR